MRSDDAKPLHFALLLSDYQQQNSGQTYNQKPEIIAGHRHDMAGKTAPNNPHQASQQWRTGTRDNPARGGAKPGKFPRSLNRWPFSFGLIPVAHPTIRHYYRALRVVNTRMRFGFAGFESRSANLFCRPITPTHTTSSRGAASWRRISRHHCPAVAILPDRARHRCKWQSQRRPVAL